MKKTINVKHVKIFAVAAIATVLSTTVFAQGGEAAFNKGSKTLGFALGIGVDRYSNPYGNDFARLPALMLIYDQGFFEDVGPGTIGIGGVVGFKSSHYDYDYYYYDNNFNYRHARYRNSYADLILAVRGTYHLTILKDKNNKFDPYAGITIGVGIGSHSYNNPHYADDIYDYAPVYPVAGAFIGAKYNLTPRFGFFAEAGYDISLVRIGFNINF
jgi:hypothetical protein